ncbi:FAD-dependent oxidoreductase, partial (plasmid) [Chromobacterium amazonense]
MARSQPRILILGGGYAGLHLARLCATHFSRIASITLIDASDHWCERIRFHQLAAGQELPRYAYAQMLSSLNVEFVQAQVESIQPKERCVIARSCNGNLEAIDYDYLVLALGSRIVAPPGLQSMLTLNDAAQAEIIHDRLKA